MSELQYPHRVPKCTCGSRCNKDSFNGMYYCWESRENCSRSGVYLTQSQCETLYKLEDEEQS